MNKLMKNNIIFLSVVFAFLYYLPCKYLDFLKTPKNLLTFKLICFATLLYSGKLGTNFCVMVAIIIIMLLYKIHRRCNIIENMVGSYNLEITNLPVPVNIIDLEERKHKNLYEKENEAVGSLFKNNFPKHIGYNEKDTIDRQMKIHSEKAACESRK